jgi:hypothetical protein
MSRRSTTSGSSRGRFARGTADDGQRLLLLPFVVGAAVLPQPASRDSLSSA